jgi:hypothetical protein
MNGRNYAVLRSFLAVRQEDHTPATPAMSTCAIEVTSLPHNPQTPITRMKFFTPSPSGQPGGPERAGIVLMQARPAMLGIRMVCLCAANLLVLAAIGQTASTPFAKEPVDASVVRRIIEQNSAYAYLFVCSETDTAIMYCIEPKGLEIYRNEVTAMKLAAAQSDALPASLPQQAVSVVSENTTLNDTSSTDAEPVTSEQSPASMETPKQTNPSNQATTTGSTQTTRKKKR